MKRGVLHALVLVVLAVLAAGGYLFWRGRPWRVLVSVNGRTLTAEEAERCADGLFGITSRDTMDSDLRLIGAARAWTFKEVLLQEAVARSVKVSADEMEVSREAVEKKPLRGFGFEEAVLVSSLVLHEAVEKTFAEKAFAPTNTPDATALFRGRVNARLGRYFSDVFARASVRSVAYPELERPGSVLSCLSDETTRVFPWLQWQLRPVVAVGEKTLTARELEWRAVTLLDDKKRVEHMAIPPEREEEALAQARRQAAQMWIVKEVMLAEAVAQKIKSTPADEKESLVQTAARLKSRKLTPEQFFREGPIPEALKRRDFLEGVLINLLCKKEVLGRISLTTKQIDVRLAELQKTALLETKQGEKPKVEPKRKTAIDMLRAEAYRRGFRRLFRELYGKTGVRCPEFPAFETLDGVSPSRAEDDERKETEK